jgi:hypothetical protein
MDLNDQRRSENVQQGNTALQAETDRRNAIIRHLFSKVFPQESPMADSVTAFAKQQERTRLENLAAALRSWASDVSSLGGLVGKVPTPSRFRSAVVGPEIPRDMELQLLAAEALRQARAQ